MEIRGRSQATYIHAVGEDRLFDVSLARWLAERLPNSRIELIKGGRTFVMLELPQRVAELIAQQATVVADSRRVGQA